MIEGRSLDRPSSIRSLLIVMSKPNQPRAKLESIPTEVAALADYERLARDFIDFPAYEYIAGGSGEENTLRQNLNAFADLQISNRVLADCRQGSTAITLLNQQLQQPILLAPVAFQKLVHPEGELATARGAEAMETCMVTSTLSSCSLEDIAGSTRGDKWFQLYFQPRREHTLDLLRRAEAAGYSAIVVTLDTPLQAVNRRAQRAGFKMPNDVIATNLQDHTPPPQVALNPGQSIIFQGMMNEAPQWDDLRWLLEQTQLPVIAKGVLHPADARQLQQLGIAAIVVSNHGGRALDHVPATLRALPVVRSAVGEDYPLLLDGGIRSGYDAFKALAAGANAVLIGRPQIYALAVAGALGVAHSLKLLRDELELCMALAGVSCVADINRGSLYPL